MEAVADSQNMQKILEDFPDQCEQALRLGKDIRIQGPFEHIIFAGMGGSGFAGDLARSLFPQEKPIIAHKDYELPAFTTKKSLVFCMSYSGNTEETVSAYRRAIKIGCQTVSVCSGGKLKELAQTSKSPLILIPGGIPPRLAIGYLFLPVMNVLLENGQLPDLGAQVKPLIKTLRSSMIQKGAVQLAEKLRYRVPVLYTSDRLAVLGKAWKAYLNENAKIHAFANVLPELNHNEICGYTNINACYYVVMMRDDEDAQQIKKRISVTKDLIKRAGVSVTEMGITGESALAKLFSALYLGMWTSYYLAIFYETDPTPVAIIEDLKQKLK